MAAVLFPLGPALAQDAPLRPGEAFVTRFSGVTAQGGQPALDLNGTVGSIIDLRAPGQPPQGQHWIDEPQRRPITAGEVGQVFGVALDDQPNIYLTSTAAFGLHRTADNAEWMPGMFGPGGPGAIYRLDRNAGYRPTLFAQVTLNGRQNTGAGLGNIAYDRWNRQFFVSDLETGMIHRLRADGQDLGVWDHGTQGRASFLDMEAKQPKSLQPVAFNPSSRALVQDCPSGNFAQSPDCWNVAESGRRVWGLGVMRNAQTGETRLYYSVWSSPTFGNAAWNNLPEDEKRNSLWSVRLGPDGGFDPASVQREFLLPDFFVKPEDVARAGFSQPVSDISFATCGPKPVMLVAERGGLRNLGLGAENAFATPHESRSLRYEYDTQNGWRPVGRYDVGTYARAKEGQPFMRANCSGGVAYGYAYNATYTGVTQPDQFVWNSGDALCSPDGPCNMLGAQVAAGQQPPPPSQLGKPQQVAAAGQGGLPPGQEGEEQQSDDSPVHGIQGLDENAYDEVVPQGAFAEASQTEPYPSTGLSQSYMIDTDINIGEAGGANDAEFSRNDATRIGDVAIFQVCPTQAMGFMPLPPPPVIDGHVPAVSHAMYASHGRAMSHYRFGSHAPEFSHHRFRSHYRHWSHHRFGSHERHRSHYRWGSHNQRESHSRLRSHNRTLSHYRSWSHNPVWSHRRLASHDLRRSHHRWGSHNARESHQRLQSHIPSLSHTRLGSHNRALSHVRTGSHNPLVSHVPSLSHSKQGSHSPTASHGTQNSHSRSLSHIRTGSHRPGASHSSVLSHNRAGSINVPATPAEPTHSRRISLGKPTGPVHLRAISAGPVKPVHSRVISAGPVKPVHGRAISLGNTKPVHSRSTSIGSRPSVRPIVTPKPTSRPQPVVRPQPRIHQGPVHIRQRSMRQSGGPGPSMAGPGFSGRF